MDESTLPWSGIARLVLHHHEDGEASGSCIDVSTLSTDALSVEQMVLFRSWLSDHETVRAERFLHAEDRRDFVAAHALLRLQLRHHFPELPFPARIAADGQGGKPRLRHAHDSDGTAIDFNISHTRGMVACVTARDHDVGIDSPLVLPAMGVKRRVHRGHGGAEQERTTRAYTNQAPGCRFLKVSHQKPEHIQPAHTDSDDANGNAKRAEKVLCDRICGEQEKRARRGRCSQGHRTGPAQALGNLRCGKTQSTL